MIIGNKLNLEVKNCNARNNQSYREQNSNVIAINRKNTTIVFTHYLDADRYSDGTRAAICYQ